MRVSVNRLSTLCVVMGLVVFAPMLAAGTGQVQYVGSGKCAECHQEQYKSFLKNSQKAHSFDSVKIMQKKLTPEEYRECFGCHTTGYGKPGGFVSEDKTPQMKNAGCEVCHGPGGKHVQSESAEDIKGKLTVEDCAGCHNEQRVGAFRFRPLIYGGGH